MGQDGQEKGQVVEWKVGKMAGDQAPTQRHHQIRGVMNLAGKAPPALGETRPCIYKFI